MTTFVQKVKNYKAKEPRTKQMESGSQSIRLEIQYLIVLDFLNKSCHWPKVIMWLGFKIQRDEDWQFGYIAEYA